MSTIKRSQQEARRFIGGQMLLDGHDVDEVMDALQAVRSTVLAWQKTVEQHGLAGLLRKGHSGRTAKLSDNERQQLTEVIRAGAVAYGFTNEQWTSKRVCLVILERFHVEYNSNYVCEILKSLDLSPQLPQVCSAKRDQAAIDRWKRYVWPVIKKNR